MVRYKVHCRIWETEHRYDMMQILEKERVERERDRGICREILDIVTNSQSRIGETQQ